MLLSIAFQYFFFVVAQVIGQLLSSKRCLFCSCDLLLLDNLLFSGFVLLFLGKLLGDVTLKPRQVTRLAWEGFFTDEVRVLQSL